MWFRLASLWGCSIREAQQRCGSREFTAWMAHYNLDPWGPERIDLMLSIGFASIMNMFVGKGKKVKPTDLMPFYRKPKPKQSVAEMQAVILAAAKAGGYGIHK